MRVNYLLVTHMDCLFPCETISDETSTLFLGENKAYYFAIEIMTFSPPVIDNCQSADNGGCPKNSTKCNYLSPGKVNIFLNTVWQTLILFGTAVTSSSLLKSAL